MVGFAELLRPRERLAVTTVVCANGKYRILNVEQAKQGLPTAGTAAQSLTSLGTPTVEWTLLARGMGVDAVSVRTAEELARHLRLALEREGPYLIEAVF